jgi:hypothetical protein
MHRHSLESETRGHTRRHTLAVKIQNTVGGSDHLREFLEKHVLRRDSRDAHEEMLKTLDVDIHNLRNKIGDLVILKRR